MAESLVHRLASCVTSLDIGVPALAQAWLPRGGALVAGPQSLNNAAQFSPALAGLRDWCAGARLPTSAGTALPVRAYITRAPDWTPALERFPEDDTRVVDGGARGGVRAALAVPIFGGRGDASEAPPVAVLEVLLCDECLSFGDLFIAVGAAAYAAGLRSSFNRAFCFAPAAVPAPQSPVLARLSAALAAICAGLALPLAQVWVPCLVADDVGGREGAARPAAQLQTRGMPACVTDAALWAYRVACTERALQAGEGIAGAAWQCRSMLWVADAASMCRDANPLRAFAALMGVTSAAALCVSGGAAEADCYCVELLFPQAACCAAAQLALLSRVQMALEATCAAAGMRCASAADVRALATAAFGGNLPATATEAAVAVASVNGAAAPPGPQGYAVPSSFFEPPPPPPPAESFGCGSGGFDWRASLSSAAGVAGRDADAALMQRYAAASPAAAARGPGSGSVPSGLSGRRKRDSGASRDSSASRGPATAAGFVDGAPPPPRWRHGADGGFDDGDEDDYGDDGACVGASDEEEAAHDAAARHARRESHASFGGGDDDEGDDEDEEAPDAAEDGAIVGLLSPPPLPPGMRRGLAPAPPPGPREDAAFATPPPPRSAAAGAGAAAAAASAAAKAAQGAFFSERRRGYATAAVDALLMPPPPPPPPGAETGSTPVGGAESRDAAPWRSASPRVASPAAAVTPTATAAVGARGGGHTQS